MRSCLKFDILRGIEYVILAAFFGFVPVFFCLMVTVIIASVLFGTKALGPWTLWSFVPAVAINVLLLKKWVKVAYQMSGKALVSVYLFYSIIGLGMCMGIPLVSFTLGIAAGLYRTSIRHYSPDRRSRRGHAPIPYDKTRCKTDVNALIRISWGVKRISYANDLR